MTARMPMEHEQTTTREPRGREPGMRPALDGPADVATATGATDVADHLMDVLLDARGGRRAPVVERSVHDVTPGQLLDALLAALPIGVAVIDPTCRVALVNAALARATGVSATEHRGRAVQELLGRRARGVRRDVRHVLETGRPVLDRRMRGALPAAPGVTRSVRVSYLPLADGRGEVRGVIALVRETTMAERTAAARRRLALDHARLQERARQVREQAEAASQAKATFLAMMSHEIRTPINAILGYGDLLELGLAGPLTAPQREQLARLQASSRHLLALVNDVLDLAKVEAGRLVLAREQASAPRSVRGALQLVQPQAEARELVVRDACGDEPGARYMGDPRRVEQILVSLLSNAVRFTAPGGQVTVRSELTDAPGARARVAVGTPCVCAIHVEDTGIGIAPEHLGSIFDPFMQVDSGHTRTREGTGLGLALSRRMARLMGGDLTVASRPGHGSVFTLWLPGVPVVHARGDGDECTIVERRAITMRGARGLAEIGDALRRDLDAITAGFHRRLRGDAAIPATSALTDAQLLDHTATFVTELALALAIVEESAGAPTQLMRDGTEIQRVIAERHGRLRHQHGFDAAALDREYDHLRAELAAAVHRAVTGQGAEQALALVHVLLERARVASVAAMRRVGEA